jgi:hypothetical protein
MHMTLKTTQLEYVSHVAICGYGARDDNGDRAKTAVPVTSRTAKNTNNFNYQTHNFNARKNSCLPKAIIRNKTPPQ